MAIEFLCSNCNRLLQAPDGSEGKQSQCPDCHNRMRIPTIEVDVVESQLEVPCPRCKQILYCDPSLEGTRGLCRGCNHIFTISNDPRVIAAEKAAKTFAFSCPKCNHLFEGKPEMVGRKAKCPECVTVFIVQQQLVANDLDDLDDKLPLPPSDSKSQSVSRKPVSPSEKSNSPINRPSASYAPKNQPVESNSLANAPARGAASAGATSSKPTTTEPSANKPTTNKPSTQKSGELAERRPVQNSSPNQTSGRPSPYSPPVVKAVLTSTTGSAPNRPQIPSNNHPGTPARTPASSPSTNETADPEQVPFVLPNIRALRPEPSLFTNIDNLIPPSGVVPQNPAIYQPVATYEQASSITDAPPRRKSRSQGNSSGSVKKTLTTIFAVVGGLTVFGCTGVFLLTMSVMYASTTLTQGGYSVDAPGRRAKPSSHEPNTSSDQSISLATGSQFGIALWRETTGTITPEVFVERLKGSGMMIGQSYPVNRAGLYGVHMEMKAIGGIPPRELEMFSSSVGLIMVVYINAADIRDYNGASSSVVRIGKDSKEKMRERDNPEAFFDSLRVAN